MKDVIVHWERLRAHADECAMMRNLSTDEQKRKLFALLAEQLGRLASEAERLPNSIAVHFACPYCNLVYRAMQVRSTDVSGGSFTCTECNNSVHSWIGLYGYFFGRPVTHRSDRVARDDTSGAAPRN